MQQARSTHDFTFEIPCPNCRHGLPYRVNLLAANSLLPNGDVVANFPMEFDTVEVLNTSGIPIARPNPRPLQQEIEEAIRGCAPPAPNSTFGRRIDFAEVRMQADLFAYYERIQSFQPEVAPQPTLNRTHADDIENARILNHRLMAERLERERLGLYRRSPTNSEHSETGRILHLSNAMGIFHLPYLTAALSQTYAFF